MKSKICPICNKKFKIYCSQKCYGESLIGSIGYWRDKKRPEISKALLGHSNWNTGRTWISPMRS